ncbi:MAG TPA: hypothetical protein PLD19_01130 [Luteimonas sp.]|nr:hypothetical protein [Luteimonas sp.]
MACFAGCDGRSAPGDAGAAAVDAAPATPEAGADPASRFDAYYRQGWESAAGSAPGAAGSRFRRSAAVAGEVSAHFLDDYRPLETRTRAELHGLVADGSALEAFHRELAALGLDADDVIDVMALHDAIHWSVVNRDRVRETELAAIRSAIAPRVRARIAREGADDRARQALADRAAIGAAIRSNEYAHLVRAGDDAGVARYGDAVRRDFCRRFGVDLGRGGAAAATLSIEDDAGCRRD